MLKVLEFIVLGQVPGTTVQITFAQVLMLGAILLMAGELRVLIQRRGLLKLAARFINEIAL